MSTTPPKRTALFLWTQTENPARGPGGIPLFFTYTKNNTKVYYEIKMETNRNWNSTQKVTKANLKI